MKERFNHKGTKNTKEKNLFVFLLLSLWRQAKSIPGFSFEIKEKKDSTTKAQRTQRKRIFLFFLLLSLWRQAKSIPSFSFEIKEKKENLNSLCSFVSFVFLW